MPKKKKTVKEKKPVNRTIVIEPPITPLDLMFDAKKREKQAKQAKKKNQHGLPCANKFYAIPTSKPYLRGFIRSFEWNKTNSSIKMLIDETPTMGTYEWFSHLTNESITLVLYDNLDQEMGRLVFDNIGLTNHRCVLENYVSENYEDVDPVFTPLQHEVELWFKSVKHLRPEDVVCQETAANDEEWKNKIDTVQGED